MSSESTIEKIKKLEEKKKAGAIIKLMDGKHADAEVICAAINALANIGNEDSVNHITLYLEHEIPSVRVAACRAGIKLGSEYMKTRVRYQLSVEKDPEAKKQMQDAFNEQFG